MQDISLAIKIFFFVGINKCGGCDDVTIADGDSCTVKLTRFSPPSIMEKQGATLYLSGEGDPADKKFTCSVKAGDK